MKPRIFLSHSKEDKQFVERIANDLRSASIDVWYDEWEIPPGESIRKKIFEEGIPNCDVFFVYITENSIDSYWVDKELDAMMVVEAENKSSQMALFVSKDEIRSELATDLRALNIPEFNDDNYIIPFSKLISRIWSVYLKKVVREKAKDTKLRMLSLENEKLQLEKLIIELQNHDLMDFSKLENRLKSKVFESNGKKKNLLQIFNAIKRKLADGTYEYQIEKIIGELFEIEIETGYKKSFELQFSFHFYDIIGELIIWRLIEIQKPTDEMNQIYYLSETGVNFARRE